MTAVSGAPACAPGDTSNSNVLPFRMAGPGRAPYAKLRSSHSHVVGMAASAANCSDSDTRCAGDSAAAVAFMSVESPMSSKEGSPLACKQTAADLTSRNVLVGNVWAGPIFSKAADAMSSFVFDAGTKEWFAFCSYSTPSFAE